MRNFNVQEAIEVLERTPEVLTVLLPGLSDGWLRQNEGEETWNAIQIVEHLIEGERSNWLPRLEAILGGDGNAPLPAFNRFAHLQQTAESTIDERIAHFRGIRMENITRLKLLIQTDSQLENEGQHPEFGTVKARELLSTWAVHDLAHLAQMMRVMAKRYKEDVGPWIAYLGILK